MTDLADCLVRGLVVRGDRAHLHGLASARLNRSNRGPDAAPGHPQTGTVTSLVRACREEATRPNQPPLVRLHPWPYPAWPGPRSGCRRRRARGQYLRRETLAMQSRTFTALSPAL